MLNESNKDISNKKEGVDIKYDITKENNKDILNDVLVNDVTYKSNKEGVDIKYDIAKEKY